MAFPPHEQPQGVKGITLRVEKQNPISTCILKQIYMNFSFQLDGIKTHFPCSIFLYQAKYFDDQRSTYNLEEIWGHLAAYWQISVEKSPTGRARCFSELWKSSQRVAHHPMGRAFAGGFWRPFHCRNRAQETAFEGNLSLLSNTIGIFQFGVGLTCQKSNLPRLVKICQMRLPQGRVLLQSTFECLPQPQIELMIAHWKYICV